MTEDNDKITPKEVSKKMLHIGDKILIAAMDSVETYWSSNNEKATRKANKERRAWRRLAERLWSPAK